MARPEPHNSTRATILIALILGLGLHTPPVHAEPPPQTFLPAGFPTELAVPFATPVVFLTGSAQIIGDDGRPRPHARTCEFSRTDNEDATRLMAHYLAHFAREGWSGEVTERGSERVGTFEHEDVQATVHLRQRASGVLAFTLAVKVLEH